MEKFTITPAEAKQYASFYFQKAQEADAVYAWDEAIKCYTLAIELRPKKAIYYRERAETFLSSEHSDRLKLAKLDYDQAILFDPDNDFSYYRRSLIKIELSMETSSFNDLSKAIMINPNDYRYFEQRAELFIQKEAYNDAILDLTQAIKLIQQDEDLCPTLLEELYFRRAQVYATDSRSSYALEDCKRVLQYDPENINCLFLQGCCYEKLGLDQMAYDTFRFAHYKADTDDNFYTWLATKRMQMEDWNAALEDLDEAIDTYNNHEAYALRAEVKEQLDDTAGALEDYKIAYTLKG